MPKIINIGVAGVGTVGARVVQLFEQKAGHFSQVLGGAQVKVVAISGRDKTKDRGFKTSDYHWCKNAVEIAKDPDVQLVVELIGGADGVALEVCTTALANGKHVVTANKALLAKHGKTLAELAKQNKVQLKYEAAVAGGIPIIKLLQEGLIANSYARLCGIINGTCNYILSVMESQSRSFNDVLKEAQKLGYAETPPDLDIDGHDTAHKLALLTALAFGKLPTLEGAYIEGIRKITSEDIKYARDFGYAIRLLGVAKRAAGGEIEQRVHPCLVPLTSPLAQVTGAVNAVMLETDEVGPVFIAGAGAGAKPTASAVVADICDIALARKTAPFIRSVVKLKTHTPVDIIEHRGPYYIRTVVADHDGVLAALTNIFGQNGISIERVTQTPDDDKGTATIVMITRNTKESAVRTVISLLKKASYVRGTPQMIRVEMV